MTSANRRATIVGAGFSGLASAFYLVRAGFDVEIYESSGRAGGLIQTVETANGLVETAANAFLNSILVEDLFATVQVPMTATKRSARRRFIFRDGRCRRWPLGLRGSFRVVLFLFNYFLNRRRLAPQNGESIQHWGHRALGREASAYLLDTALQGIYAGDPARLGASLILGRFFNPHLKPSSPRLRGSVAPPNGMGQLIKGLVTYLQSKGVKFYFGAQFSLGGSDPVIIATGAKAAAEILRSADPVKAALLDQVEYSPVVSATVFFDSTDSKSKGFGVLFPPVENRQALGVLKNNFIFDDRVNGGFAETWVMGGAMTKADIVDMSDDEILRNITSERAAVFGLSERPKAAKITRWPKGIPHYTCALEAILPELNKPSGNVFLMGNYLGDLGLAKILERASGLPARLAKEQSL